jgi:outer membrane protein OmpA-like peptidoglycan-associated protein
MTEISFRRLARTSFIVAVAATAFSWNAAAFAQVQMYPGDDVTVNPWAVPEPAATRNLPPVHLHPPHPARPVRPWHKPARPRPKAPVKKRRVVKQRAVKPHLPKPALSHPHPAVAIPVHKPVHRPAPGQRKAAAPVRPQATAIPFSFGTTHVPAAAPVAAHPSVSAAAPAPSHTAGAVATPHITVPKGLSKQASVLFNRNSFGLSDNTNATLNDLAFSLKTALASGASRVELVGYGGNPGSTSSSARRLSLERALAVRQALIADGVPAERIDVRALGGVPANDHGATDRVDIFIKS